MGYAREIPQSVTRVTNGVADPVLNAITAVNGVPAGETAGFSTGNHRFLHLFINESAGGTCVLKIWGRTIDGTWGVLYTIDPTSGLYAANSVAVSANMAAWICVQINGMDRCYIEALTFAGSGAVTVRAYTNDGGAV